MNPMDRKFHTVSIEDREMFAYNAKQTKLQKFMSTPENRIHYAYEFYNEMLDDRYIQLKAFEKALEWIAKCDDQTAHF
jgi:hypothetical protein